MNNVGILFDSNRFNLSEVKDHFINPTCFGEDLAGWLRTKLLEQGIPTIEPDQEDWGWYIESTLDGNAYFIGIGGNPDEQSGDPNQGEWRISIEKHRSFRDKLTGKNQISRDEPIIAVVRGILEREEDFKNIRFE
jgi:hypothetical protein